MSFSSGVKEELSSILPETDHCARAELAAFLDPARAARDPHLLERLCCKKAFLRGIFLAAGSISNPDREYQLEIVVTDGELSDFIAKLLNSFSILAKTVERKEHHVVYLKDGDQISEFLALIQANVSVLNMESIRVIKDVRNSINRRVNCEAANLNKSVLAGLKQVKEIEFIRDNIGFENLPAGLSEVAELRLAYPEAPLAEIGMMLNPPVSKSAINHRFRKLREIAEEENYDN